MDNDLEVDVYVVWYKYSNPMKTHHIFAEHTIPMVSQSPSLWHVLRMDDIVIQLITDSSS